MFLGMRGHPPPLPPPPPRMVSLLPCLPPPSPPLSFLAHFLGFNPRNYKRGYEKRLFASGGFSCKNSREMGGGGVEMGI